MTRAVLPNPSARAEWLLAGLIDRALNHLGRALPLDGGNDDDDGADTGTDTAMPDDDDDDDIASSKTTGCASESFLTCSPLNGQSTSDVLRDSFLFQTDRGPTGRNALAS